MKEILEKYLRNPSKFKSSMMLGKWDRLETGLNIGIMNGVNKFVEEKKNIEGREFICTMNHNVKIKKLFSYKFFQNSLF